MRRTWNGLVDLRRLLRAYWKLRKDGRFSLGRVNSALRISMERDTKQAGMTWAAHGRGFTFSECNCEDAKHNRYCSHKVAARMLAMAEALKEETKDGDGTVYS